ncbi:phosphonate ABC transporter ATP-binding protein [Kordiimonas marina]|uniref:phosphonate ABC transporter ATP-binding protein n=1 Tax=Kordiimonas marina TaxID=2872312 RepID=UPI001FF4E80F|nr:ATP-binding cassette domain-containing protein [Kordiimonas marina]MCJ9430481.1 ATP-binding cassette domain-containing protein [Kordiimonas marina]
MTHTPDMSERDGAAGADAPLLCLEDVSVAPSDAADPVLSRVSLEVRAGECIALVGASGAGKTTLLRTIGTLLPVRAGRLTVAGQEPSALSEADLRALRTRIGLITQSHDLVDSLRVDKNVMAGALGRWTNVHALRFLLWSKDEELAEARAALEAVGIADKLMNRTSALSGGERQRVSIARALIQAPALLLADEPVASLDPETAEDVLALLTSLARARGMALITSLHQPELAERFCDRIVEVAGGTVTERPRLVTAGQSA